MTAIDFFKTYNYDPSRVKFKIRKSFIESNISDEMGYTVMFTEEKELLLIQCNKKNPNPSFRPKFFKGSKCIPRCKSEFTEYIVLMYLDALNEENIAKGAEYDGTVLSLSESLSFTALEVASEFDGLSVSDPSYIKVYQLVESNWLAKNPIKTESNPLEGTDLLSIGTTVNEPVAEVEPVEVVAETLEVEAVEETVEETLNVEGETNVIE